jgi:ribosomal protein L37AE/L43A
MKIETKFGMGQRVFKIHKSKQPYRAVCDECGGKDIITATGKVVKCPKCGYATFHGYPKGTVQKYKESAWHIDRTLTIGKITAERYATEGGDPDSMFVNKKAGQQDKTSYMAWESGVGSGSVYYEQYLFATEEEAQAECDRRNAEEGEEDDTAHER